MRKVEVKVGQPGDPCQLPTIAESRSRAKLLGSGGSWLQVDEHSVVFDATEPGLGLGYNSSALMGVLQHIATWEGDPEASEFVAFQISADDFFSRRSALGEPIIADRNVTRLTSGIEECRQSIKAYIAANVLDQLEARRELLGARARELLLGLARETADEDVLSDASSSRLNVLSVDFRETLSNWQQRMLDAGIVAELKGSVAEFRFAVSTTDSDLKIFAERLLSVWKKSSPSPASVSLRDMTEQYEFHRELLRTRQAIAAGLFPEPANVRQRINSLLPTSIRDSGHLSFVSQENWGEFRESIRQLQTAVYEPARQTAIEKFDTVVKDQNGLGLVVQVDDTVAGIAFAAPVVLFPEERGTLEDPYRENRRVLYMLDVTVLPEHRGSLGRALKQGITLLAASRGCAAIHGRNRDRLAGAMWSINLGLGSYELMHLFDDYPDQEEYRDCIYYRCPLTWPANALLTESDLDVDNLARLVNL